MLDESWLINDDGSPVETVLITAGASAPEDLVAELCRTLVSRYGATIELADIYEEDVEFGLPGTLKKAMRGKGIDPSDRRIRVHAPVVTEELYGAVPLTVSAAEQHPGAHKQLAHAFHVTSPSVLWSPRKSRPSGDRLSMRSLMRR
jgi:hypothetical protein